MKKLIALFMSLIFVTAPVYATDEPEYYTPGKAEYQIKFDEFRDTYLEIFESHTSYSTITFTDLNSVDAKKITEIITDDFSWISGVDCGRRALVWSDDSNVIELKIAYVTSPEQRKEVDDFVKAWVRENISSDMSDFQKTGAIFDKVAEYDYYETDESDTSLAYQQRYTVYGLLKNGKGVCNASAGMFRLLAEEAGLETKDVLGRTVSGELHIWNLVQIEDKWFHVDTTADMGPVRKSNWGRRGFLKGDNHMSIYMTYLDDIKDLAADGSYFY